MISYSADIESLTSDQLGGFFAGWLRSPSLEQFHAVLRGSYRVLVAIDEHTNNVVGFITAISDGVLTAFIPWLEVLPGYQGQGIGTELLRRMLTTLGHFYSIDLTCDDDLADFYTRHGMIRLSGMGCRNPNALDDGDRTWQPTC